jgi:hypothetical protein
MVYTNERSHGVIKVGGGVRHTGWCTLYGVSEMIYAILGGICNTGLSGDKVLHVLRFLGGF